MFRFHETNNKYLGYGYLLYYDYFKDSAYSVKNIRILIFFSKKNGFLVTVADISRSIW